MDTPHDESFAFRPEARGGITLNARDSFEGRKCTSYARFDIYRVKGEDARGISDERKDAGENQSRDEEGC